MSSMLSIQHTVVQIPPTKTSNRQQNGMKHLNFMFFFPILLLFLTVGGLKRDVSMKMSNNVAYSGTTKQVFLLSILNG